MRIILLSAFLLFSVTLLAQNNYNTLAFPSANNSFLGKPIQSPSVNVDQYTGTAVVSIPICNLASKELNIPVSADYVDGRGVKVQEYASQIGLGWQLNTGGIISRVVRGLPDEQPNGYLGTNQWGTQWGALIASSWYGTYGLVNNSVGSLNSTQVTQLKGIASNGSMVTPVADGEPDIFYVKTPFFNFQFVFNGSGVPVFSNTLGFKVIPKNFTYSSNYTSTSFEIIDDKGNQFYFGSSPLSLENTSDSLYGNLYVFPTTWYLDKIVTFNSKDIITLTYTGPSTTDVSYHYSWTQAMNQYGTTQTYYSNGTTKVSQPKFINKISGPLGEIDFNYTYNTRLDDPNVPYLNSIVTYANNPQTNQNTAQLQTYNFNYSYFGSPSSDPNIVRLQLTGITAAGFTSSTSTPVTLASFNYNTTQLPTRNSQSFDFWGYPTTAPSINPTLKCITSRPSDPTMGQGGVLTSIGTLAGSTWNLYYQLNDYWNGSANTTVGGLRVYQITQTLPTGETLTKTYGYKDPAGTGNSTGQILNPLYIYLGIGMGSAGVQFSESPLITSDMNGNFIGYSNVTMTDQNGGYTITNFSNFNDANCNDILQQNFTSGLTGSPSTIVSSASLSYKRGLQKNIYVYNKTNTLLSKTTFNYSSLNSTIGQDAFSYRSLNLAAVISGTLYGGVYGYGLYYTPIENYRVTQIVHADFDQVTPPNSVTTTTNYTYDTISDPLNHNRLIIYTSTTDSKGQSHTQSVYHSVDIANNIANIANAIPMISGSPETNTISAMVSSNYTGAVIHNIDNKNNTINQTHNTYSQTPYGQVNNTYLASASAYTSDPVNIANTLVNQQFYYYDASSSDLISTNSVGGKSTAVSYGYNSSYPIAKVIDASSSVSYSNQAQSQTGIFNIPPNTWGSQTVNFTTYYPGTITIAMPPGSYLSGSVTCFFSFSLNGPSSGSGSLCNSSVSGYTCSASNSVSFSNMPAGNYILSVQAQTNTATSTVPVNYTYQGYQIVPSTSNEFFFEGFELNSGGTTGFSHSGNLYYNGNYIVPFTPPNGRSYLIQYWNLSGGAWNFNQSAYTTNMTLTGPVDDIRVFPKDALMTSYTYSPIVGKTSETDPAGRTVIYQYDGLNRLQTVRDQDNNILKQYDYEFQLLTQPVYNDPEYGSFQMSCSSGYIGTYVTYTVPAGKYSSYVNKNVANQLAINDVNANGQTYANNPANGGRCLVAETIGYTDSRTFQYTVRLTNNSSGQVYNFTSNANSSGTLGQVPSGTYTVYICPINNYTPNNNYTVFGSSQFNVVCTTFNNVSITSNGNIYFQ